MQIVIELKQNWKNLACFRGHCLRRTKETVD